MKRIALLFLVCSTFIACGTSDSPSESPGESDASINSDTSTDSDGQGLVEDGPGSDTLQDSLPSAADSGKMDSGLDAASPLCPGPYFYCLESCNASTASLPPSDWCNNSSYKDGCPAGTVSTTSCGYCKGWSGVDCWGSSSMPTCEYYAGAWTLCCAGDCTDLNADGGKD